MCSGCRAASEALVLQRFSFSPKIHSMHTAKSTQDPEFRRKRLASDERRGWHRRSSRRLAKLLINHLFCYVWVSSKSGAGGSFNAACGARPLRPRLPPRFHAMISTAKAVDCVHKCRTCRPFGTVIPLWNHAKLFICKLTNTPSGKFFLNLPGSSELITPFT